MFDADKLRDNQNKGITTQNAKNLVTQVNLEREEANFHRMRDLRRSCQNVGWRLPAAIAWCNWLFLSFNASVATSLWKRRWVSSSSIAQPGRLFTYAIWVMFRAVDCALLAIICEIILGKRSASFWPMRRTGAKRSPLSSVRRRKEFFATAIGSTLRKQSWIECRKAHLQI